jgi:hypothetical protein
MTMPGMPSVCTNWSVESGQMTEQAAVALGLALLRTAKDGIELVDGLARHDRAQPAHHRLDHRQVGVKVGTRKAKQRTQLVVGDHHRVRNDAGLGMGTGDHQRKAPAPPADPAHHIGPRGPVEQRLKHFEPGELAGQAAHLQHSLDFRGDESCRTRRIVKAASPRQIGQQGLEARHEPFLQADLGNWRGFRSRFAVISDKLHGGVHADRCEYLARQGIEKRRMELAVGTIGGESCEFGPGRAPGGFLCDVPAQRTDESGQAAFHAMIVELDALDRIALTELPLARLEAPLRTARDAAETVVVVLEGSEDGRRCPDGTGVNGRIVITAVHHPHRFPCPRPRQ